MLGQTIGHYRVEKEIGSGGMGVVYRATDEFLGRPVAIKLLRQETLKDPDSEVRFLREARAVAALSHPSIATIYEAGEHQGYLFLAMEFLEGRTLSQELAGGPLPESRLRDYACQLADALQHAHSRGILHRDIKSSNVMLCPGGRLKLLDFGLARMVATGDETLAQQTLTAKGMWVGTMHYVAPEVLSGEQADFRSDLYSLGVVFYEMASGELPFAGLAGPALVGAVLRGEYPPLSRRNPALSAAMAAVIGRTMALDRIQRPASAAELLESLRQSVAGSQVTAVQPQSQALSLAILEFQNLSGNPEHEWLGTGIAETLSADLKKLKALRVVSRERVQASARALSAAGPPDLQFLGRDLRARWLVSGSYQRAGDRVRITPRLLEVDSGDELPLEKVDGKWDDIFDLQDRVVKDIMAALEMRVDSSAMHRIAAPETRKLEAYEHYAQGRKLLIEFRGKESLEEARRRFEEAIKLDAGYALAVSGLGATYAMRFIHRTDPDDLLQAKAWLERARELDPEIGHPYPWLCYVYTRQGNCDLAVEAGRKGTELQPDLFQAHYFLGAAHMIFTSLDPAHFQHAIPPLLRSAELESGYGASWVNLGWIALVRGHYGEAERYLTKALELDRAKAPMRFVGSQVMLAELRLRQGQEPAARDLLAESAEALATTDHVYKEAMLALTACLAGELALRTGDGKAATADFRRARGIVKEYPRMLGNQRVWVRTLAGVAAACAVGSEGQRASELLSEAEENLSDVLRHPESFVWQATDPQLCHSVAAASLLVGETEKALHWLERSAAHGWGDTNWLEGDSQLAPLRGQEPFRRLLARIRSAAPLRFESRSAIAAR